MKKLHILHTQPRSRLIQPLWRRHRCLDRQAPYILPPFLQQADQVVDGQHYVGYQLILRHAHVPNCNSQAENLLQLKLDG